MLSRSHLLMIGLLMSSSGAALAQEISFDQGNWSDARIDQQRRSAPTLVNEERLDTMYMEDLYTGEMEMVVEASPVVRIEYYPDGVVRRHIEIRQELRSDSTYVEQQNGEMRLVMQDRTVDIPFGTYHEFFPNGRIRMKGVLNGYDSEGQLIKTGEWTEWNTDGEVIRQETYP